jgi:hypothetical protein
MSEQTIAQANMMVGIHIAGRERFIMMFEGISAAT